MSHKYILEYCEDGEWLVGRLKGIPGVFSQGASLHELIENIEDAYRMMTDANEPQPVEVEPQFRIDPRFQSFRITKTCESLKKT